MPITLHPTVRYRVIDECLQKTYKIWPWQALSVACGEALRKFVNPEINDPSERTIKGDIRKMRSGALGYEAPIIYDQKVKGYRYEDPEFSITKGALSEQDLLTLKNAVGMLKQYRGFNQLLDLEEIIHKLENNLAKPNEPQNPLIQFDQAPGNLGQQWLSDLYLFIVQKQNMEVHYQPFDHERSKKIIVSPYLLKEYNKRWFVIGWRHDTNKMINLALDRIKHLFSDRSSYYFHHGFNPKQYYQDIIGVTLLKDNAPQTIRLFAIPLQAKYIITKPIHLSQQVESITENGTIFSYKLAINFELVSHLLSFGERIQVLEPPVLVNEMKKRLETAVSNYKKHK